jgi:hypothetical protein
MKTMHITLVLLFICIANLLQAQTLFQKKYGGNNFDYNGNVIQTQDGGYLFSGWTQSYGHGISDIYLIKTDGNGDTMWNKTYGTNQVEVCKMSLQISSGAYILTGYRAITNEWKDEAFLMKIDLNGNILWQKTYGGNYRERGSTVQQTTDGGFILGGVNESFMVAGYGPYLVKTDSNGNLSWAKSYGPGDAGLDGTSIVKQTFDGGFMIFGPLKDGMNGYSDFRLIKTTNDGSFSWSKAYDIFVDEVADFVQTADSGYLMLGSNLSAQGAFYDVLLIKTDINGNLLWAKTYGGAISDGGVAMTATDDGGYVLACGTTTFDGYSGIIYLIKIDSSGNILWTSRYGDIADLRVTSLCTTVDHGFMIGGASVGPNVSQYDIVAIKTDSMGKSLCNMTDTGVAVTSVQVQVWSPSVTATPGGVLTLTNFNTGPGGSVADLCMNVATHDAVKEEQISLYPNPFSDRLNITYTNPDGEIALFDFSGKEVLRQKTEKGNTIVQTSAIVPGFYILSYHDKGRLLRRKVTKY